MKVKQVESYASVTVPTVTYGSMVLSSKSVVELSDCDDPDKANEYARELVDKELQAHKAAFDNVEASFFSSKQKLK